MELKVVKKPPVFKAFYYKGEEDRDEAINWLRNEGQYTEVYWVVPDAPHRPGHILVVIPQGYIKLEPHRERVHIAPDSYIILDDESCGGLMVLSPNAYERHYEVV